MKQKGWPDQADSAEVSVHLMFDHNTRQWHTDQVVMDRGLSINQIRFHNPVEIHLAFIPEFTEKLTALLPDTRDFQVRTDPTLVIRLPQLVLGGLRVLAQPPVGGMQAVAVHFKHGMGALQSFLAPAHRTEHHTLDKLEQCAAETVEALISPCINLLSLNQSSYPLANDKNLAALVQKSLDQIEEKRGELDFFAYLLRRFIETNTPQKDLHCRISANSPYMRLDARIV